MKYYRANQDIRLYSSKLNKYFYWSKGELLTENEFKKLDSIYSSFINKTQRIYPVNINKNRTGFVFGRRRYLDE